MQRATILAGRLARAKSFRRYTLKWPLAAAFGLLFALGGYRRVEAIGNSWKGTSDVDWNKAANWNGGVPSSTIIADFSSAFAAGKSQPNMNVAGSCLGIDFETNLGQAVTISGADILSVYASGIDTHLSTQSLTISAPLSMAAAQTWVVGSGGLTVSGTVSGTGPLTFSGGQVTLSGPNTYSGGTVVNGGGLLQITGDTQLGPLPVKPDEQHHPQRRRAV